MPESDISLEDSRRELSDMVTAAVEQTAKVLQAEQDELRQRFPAMAHQPKPIGLDPAVIRDFVESKEYREAIEAYIAGRLEVNLLVRVMELLAKIAPAEFLRP
ncbi:MAG: hypothetical protein ACYTF6_13745 [Planctomycetota bacterium]|jgi:hypothetical protein